MADILFDDDHADDADLKATRAALRAHLAAREALLEQMAEALKYARRMVKPRECDVAFIDAALAAYQEGKK